MPGHDAIQSVIQQDEEVDNTTIGQFRQAVSMARSQGHAVISHSAYQNMPNETGVWSLTQTSHNGLNLLTVKEYPDNSQEKPPETVYQLFNNQMAVLDKQYFVGDKRIAEEDITGLGRNNSPAPVINFA